MTPSGATYDAQKADTSSAATGIVMLGSVLIGLLLLLIVVAFIMTVYQAPRLSRLRDADVLVQLFANLVVAFYAFPAFTRTKRRAFVALGFAALIFAYARDFHCACVRSTIADFAVTGTVVLCDDPCFRHCRITSVCLWRCIIGTISQRL